MPGKIPIIAPAIVAMNWTLRATTTKDDYQTLNLDEKV